MESQKIIKTLFFCLLFVLFLRNAYSYLDPDLGWHLRTGQDILENRGAPRFDTYNYTVFGQKWIDHEWLFNALVYSIYDGLGYLALNVLFASVLVLAFWLAWRYLLLIEDRQRAFPYFAVLAVIGAFGALANWGARMQTITFLFVILALYILKKHENRPDKPYLWSLPPLFCLWANLHGSFLIGLFILAAWTVYRHILPGFRSLPWLGRFYAPSRPQRAESRRIAAITALSFAATLLNPYGYGLYGLLAEYGDTFYQNHINEWLPAWEYPTLVFPLLYSAAVAALALGCLASKPDGAASNRKPDLFLGLLAAAFFFLSLAARRHFPLFLSVSLLMAPTLAARLAGGIRLGLDKTYRLMARLYVGLAIALALATLFLMTEFTDEPFRSRVACGSYPCAALDRLRPDPRFDRGRVLNNYDWGGYLVWTWPDKPLFIDGRFPQRPFATSTLLEEYYVFFRPGQAADKLAEYDIDQVLLKTGQPPQLAWYDRWLFGRRPEDFKPVHEDLDAYLSGHPDWELAYEDKISKVYIKPYQ